MAAAAARATRPTNVRRRSVIGDGFMNAPCRLEVPGMARKKFRGIRHVVDVPHIWVEVYTVFLWVVKLNRSHVLQKKQAGDERPPAGEQPGGKLLPPALRHRYGVMVLR